jgi:peptidoglycan L-alanyl-D-glutamate endopeptidase CwlK
MSFVLGSRSRARLKGVHPDLVRVVELALTYSPHDFTITEGLRSVARQKALLEAGASRTMNSRHITGHAIDFAVLIAGKVR